MNGNFLGSSQLSRAMLVACIVGLHVVEVEGMKPRVQPDGTEARDAAPRQQEESRGASRGPPGPPVEGMELRGGAPDPVQPEVQRATNVWQCAELEDLWKIADPDYESISPRSETILALQSGSTRRSDEKFFFEMIARSVFEDHLNYGKQGSLFFGTSVTGRSSEYFATLSNAQDMIKIFDHFHVQGQEGFDLQEIEKAKQSIREENEKREREHKEPLYMGGVSFGEALSVVNPTLLNKIERYMVDFLKEFMKRVPGMEGGSFNVGIIAQRLSASGLLYNRGFWHRSIGPDQLSQMQEIVEKREKQIREREYESR